MKNNTTIEGMVKEFGQFLCTINQKTGVMYHNDIQSCKDFLRTIFTYLEKETREKVGREIVEALKEQAEPYDGAKWHNDISFEKARYIVSAITHKHDKNGHKIDDEGRLIFDEQCRGCDAPITHNKEKE